MIVKYTKFADLILYNKNNKQRREQGRSTEQPSPLPLRWIIISHKY
jgi:hypothetical protein